ncbi:MAG: hypothetical protein GYB32_07775 [Algicola sp.]|nr:hypothetical protein [Algicola sp.]
MKRISAGALQLVTFIIVVVALLLASFLILVHVHKQFRIQTDHTIELVKLADDAIQLGMLESNRSNDSFSIPLLDESYKSLDIQHSYWGIFERISATATIKNKSTSKMALIGNQKQERPTALVLGDHNNPLVVVGNTKVLGLAYVPKRGVKSGNISGKSYYGSEFIYGEQIVSKGVPPLKREVRQQLELLVNNIESNSFEFQESDLNSEKQLVRSFSQVPLLIRSNNAIHLNDIELSGHIIVFSNKKIVVGVNSRLTDILIIAPEIDIEKNVKGSFQALATKTLLVDEDVQLTYPSALLLMADYKRSQEEESNVLKIKNGVQLKGNVVCLGASSNDNFEVQMDIAEGSLIEGEIYCEQNLELRGSLLGTVYTNNFLVREEGSIYQNHLYNAKINAKDSKEEYVGLSLGSNKKAIMKWLY